MNKSRIFLLFFLTLVYSTSMADFEIQITPSKTTYLLMEPIAFNFRVKNVGPKTVEFRKYEISNYFRVIDSKDNTDFISQYLEAYIVPTPTLKPGESVEGTTRLQCGKKLSKTSHTKTLPVEKYRVYLEVPYGEDKKSKSNTVEFEIVEPKGEEKLAYNELLVADSLYGLKDFEGTCQKWMDISRKYPASVYATHVFSKALSVLRTANADKAKLLELTHEFMDRYPNSHYIYPAALNILEYYESQKDKKGFIEELNSLIKKYPDSEVSKWAKKKLETIDNLKF